MRNLSPVYVVTSIVIALCGSATAAAAAAVVARSGATMATAPGPVTNAVPAAGSSSSGTTASSNAFGTSTTVPTNRSGTNTANSPANTVIGSNNASSFPGENPSNSNNIIGSSTASSIPNATGSSSVNASNTTTPGVTPGGIANGVVVPGIMGTNGAATSQGVDNGVATGVANGGYANAQVDQGQFNGNAGSAVDVDAARDSQTLDRAVNVVKRDRQRIGRNGQLLQTIAPRTNANRSNEMPDDPPSPALTGSSSALAR